MLGPRVEERLEVTVAEAGGRGTGRRRPCAWGQHVDITVWGRRGLLEAAGLGAGLHHAGSRTQVQRSRLIPEATENWVTVYVRT